MSIVNKYGTKDIIRLQLGIDRPLERDPDIIAAYVLSKFQREELNCI